MFLPRKMIWGRFGPHAALKVLIFTFDIVHSEAASHDLVDVRRHLRLRRLLH